MSVILRFLIFYIGYFTLLQFSFLELYKTLVMYRWEYWAVDRKIKQCMNVEKMDEWNDSKG